MSAVYTVCLKWNKWRVKYKLSPTVTRKCSVCPCLTFCFSVRSSDLKQCRTLCSICLFVPFCYFPGHSWHTAQSPQCPHCCRPGTSADGPLVGGCYSLLLWMHNCEKIMPFIKIIKLVILASICVILHVEVWQKKLKYKVTELFYGKTYQTQIII